jgi:hypothetical protein
VAWNTPNDPPEPVAGAASPAGPVAAVTTYDVVVTLGGETRAYTAEVRYHAGDRGALMPEVVDPVLSGLQQLIDDRAPLAVPQWDRYVKTRRYAAVVSRLKGLARAGKSVVPGRSPIGFLQGDDLTPQDEQLVMMTSGVPCQASCTGQPNGTPCSDEGDPSCSVDRCQDGTCAHDVVPPIGPCPGDLGWDTSGLTPGALAALACLEALVAEAGGRVTQYESAYRPAPYQDHFYSIHVAYEQLVLTNWLESECAETRLTANAEKAVHRLGPDVAPTSYHSDGTAFDVHVSVPAGYALSDEARNRCQLVRDVPNELWHWHYVGG